MSYCLFRLKVNQIKNWMRTFGTTGFREVHRETLTGNNNYTFKIFGFIRLLSIIND